jgi:pilus assembly protein CpaB
MEPKKKLSFLASLEEKKGITLTIAIVLGIVCVILVKLWLDKEKASIHQGYALVAVIAAAEDIEAGTRVDISLFAKREIPEAYISGNAIYPEDFSKVEGQVLNTSLQKGDTLRWSDIGERIKEKGLSQIITKGQRALSFPVNIVSSVSQMIKSNDHVDIIGTFEVPIYGHITLPQGGGKQKTQIGSETKTLTILQNVTVIAVGQKISTAVYEEEEEYGTVTLLVTQEEAQQLIFAQQKGTITLILRNIDDISTEIETPIITFDSIAKPEVREQLQKKRNKRIEVIRGGELIKK